MAAPHENDLLTEKIIGFAIEVHRQLGPGLLESAYEECLCYELKQNGIQFQRQVALPVVYVHPAASTSRLLKKSG